MDTIHPPKTGRPAGAYDQEELRPFSTQLAAYTRYALMIIDLRSRARSIRAMQHALKNNARLRLGRAAAQIELQNIYDHIAFGLRLPRIPVRLPLRKRVRAEALWRLSKRSNAPLGFNNSPGRTGLWDSGQGVLPQPFLKPVPVEQGQNWRAVCPLPRALLQIENYQESRVIWLILGSSTPSVQWGGYVI